jgi:hypothetical protein
LGIGNWELEFCVGWQPTQASPWSFIFCRVFSPMPLTFNKSLTEENGLAFIIACAFAGPIPVRVSNCANEAVLMSTILAAKEKTGQKQKIIKKIQTNLYFMLIQYKTLTKPLEYYKKKLRFKLFFDTDTSFVRQG